MTKRERAQVVELLETAHGYSILGSFVPFKTACADLGLKGSDVAKEAADAINLARAEMGLPEKPAAERYRDAIGLAIERVQAGEWP
jgi:hypothetical protein